MHYMASEFYTPSAVQGVRFDDPAFAIQWPLAATAWFPIRIVTGHSCTSEGLNRRRIKL